MKQVQRTYRFGQYCSGVTYRKEGVREAEAQEPEPSQDKKKSNGLKDAVHTTEV